MVLLTLLMVFCKIWSYPGASTLCPGLSCLPLSCLSCARMVPYAVGESEQPWAGPCRAGFGLSARPVLLGAVLRGAVKSLNFELSLF